MTVSSLQPRPSGGRAQRVSFNRIELWDENIEAARGIIERRREVSRVTGRSEAESITHSPVAPGSDPDLDF